ncbi:DUF4249 family protein [Robiginitalea sp. SC105]|uniref:DUF4249 family protein n=1 Tax=Robiginitalea sp. SC105 TaxID=2762332 RepID=UPI00210662EE|nr:DUF4249 family protein [Robiginitalea sp. SC105]
MPAFLLLPVLGLLLLGACEEVVEVETPQEPPRLVVGGLLRVDASEPFVPVRIQLSETAGFFGERPVTDAEAAIITVNRFDGETLIESFNSSLAEEAPGTGVYIPDPDATSDQRIPTVFLNEEVQFILQIRHKGRQYVAETWYQPVVQIDFLVQGRRTLQEGDETELIVSFTDPARVDNFYLFDFGSAEYLVTEDTFYRGQFFQFSYFYEDPIPEGTELRVSIMGADQQFYNYMDLLIEQSALEGPFQTPAATVRGNLVDATDIDNRDRFDNTDRPDTFPLGYFAVVQERVRTITIR